MKTSKENSILSWFLFVLFPFAMFVYAIKNFFNKNNQWLILAFSFLYGYTVFITTGDIARYEQSYYEIITYTWDDFIYLFTNFMNPEKYNYFALNVATGKPDVFALTTSFIVSRFTENPRWFWAVVSLINTYLIINFINTIAKETVWIKNLYTQRIFFMGLVLVVPFFYGVIGVRFWPALFLFMTYAIKYLKHKKFNYLLIAAGSLLIHYSFIVPIILLLVAAYIPNNRFIFKILIVFGIFIFISTSVSSSLNIIKDVSTTFDETTLENSVETYTDEAAISDRKEQGLKTNWYVALKNDAILYFFLILGVLDVFGILKFRENDFLHVTYPLIVVFLILLLLTKDLGSISRFKYIFYLLILSRYMVLAGIQPFDNKLKYISYIFTPIIIFYTIIIFRAGFYTVEPLLLINNAVSSFFIHSQISLSEFLIGH